MQPDGFEDLIEAIDLADTSEVEQVGFVLCEAKARGIDFEWAWKNAMRAISPPRTAARSVGRGWRWAACPRGWRARSRG